MVSSKAVLENLNLIFRSKFNHECLHWAILKFLFGFTKKRAQKARDVIQNVQNESFDILKIFKSNMKFIWATVELT